MAVFYLKHEGNPNIPYRTGSSKDIVLGKDRKPFPGNGDRGVWSCYLITYCELSVNVSHWLMCMDIQSPTLMVLFWDVIELLDMVSS